MATCTIASPCSPSSPPRSREIGSDRLLLLDHYRNHDLLGTPQFMLSAEAQQRWLLYDFPETYENCAI